MKRTIMAITREPATEIDIIDQLQAIAFPKHNNNAIISFT